MELELKYGTSILPFSFPEQTVIPEYTEPDFAISRETFDIDMMNCLPDDPLKYQKVSIIVSDKTRLCGYPEYLPWVTENLMKRGAKKDQITFFIAYGTHARQTDSESLKSYGETYNQFQFVHHSCSDEKIFKNIGYTHRGTPVEIRKDILDSTLIITFGSISHHYFAGFGGGRKLFFPGLSSRTSVYHNHGLFLDIHRKTLAEGCQPGRLEGNPLAEDLKEIDGFLPPRISIHGILNSSGKVCKLRVGNDYADFVKACAEHDHYYRYPGNETFDLVIASSGGYPKDINFIQAHKAVHHAAAFVKDGGSLIVLCECIDQIGSDYFTKYLKAGSFKSAFDILEKHYEGNGGTALSMMSKTRRIQISLLTTLDPENCEILNVKKINQADIQDRIQREKGSIAVIKNASMLIR